ncbi:Leucoanthocyanidin dioxygenase [Dichanthelium oligosanthes]|uniref:anthocyanidin synthase n=1 Tax=Dichanthelium oligosanthes TaxID=888268 RepID=A0A1E5VCG0_9POAL|nr:Leucoanthocyanidin dioxygenase [Dichanthelium oligosanthes]
MEMAMAMESPPTLPPVPQQLPARVEALSLSGLSAIPPEYVRPADERADLGDAFDLARTHAHDHTAPRIPVVDISPFLMLDSSSSSSKDDHKKRQREECVEAVRAAAADWGVMHVAGHGIPAELMDRLRAAGSAFFALPIQAKEAYANDPAAGRLQGYGSRLATNASGQREWEDYLFHLLHPDSLADHALWPAHPPDYVAATRDFGRRIREVASTLLAILSMGLLGPDHGDALEKELTRAGDEDLLLQLKINYYPRCPQPELAVGVEAHTDVSALSFILHNGVPGLQVRHDGRWVTARDEPGTLIVHVGDALEILSNARYTSVLHRGLVNREAVRVSWVVFCEPPPDAVLLRPLPELVTPDQPARFTPRTFKQHLDRKLFKKKQQQDQQQDGDGGHDDHAPPAHTN